MEEENKNIIRKGENAMLHNEKLSLIMAEKDPIVQATMLHAAALECSPKVSVFTRLIENNKIGVISLIATTIDYFQKHGFIQTLRQILVKINILNNSTPIKNNSIPNNLWDNSAENYVREGFKLYWETLGKVRDYQISLFTGDSDKDHFAYSLEFLMKRTNRTGLRGLILGCQESDNPPEMIFYQSGLFERLEVVDIAQGLIAKQKKKANIKGMDGIEYTVVDLNQATFQPDTYDLVWAMGTIHHIQNLESLFARINNALKNDGLFFTRDYVGPSRLQFTDLQLRIANGLLTLLPECYKKDRYGNTIQRIMRPSLETVMKNDPSEAVRSADIVGVMRKHLKIEKFARTGGTILHPLLNNIASNFEADEFGDSLLKMLINLEIYLVGQEIIPSDYISCTAGKITS